MIAKRFTDVLMLAREAGMLKMGTVALDGTKVKANASRHSALSYARASQIEAQLQAEVKELMALAEAAEKADVPDGMSVPEELARREKRLERIAEAKAAIEARAKERFAREQAEHEAKLKAREDKAKKKGQARWQAAAAADRRSGAQGSGQSDGRGFAHHVGSRRRLRSSLQCSGRSGGRQHAGDLP